MTTTIKDIAKRVGVNPSTVSRVINGTASISDETKQKILVAMQEMDYHPNSLARSLVNGNTFTIGLVIDAGNSDAYSNTFFIRSVSAIETVSQDRGYNLLITNDASRENNNAVKNLILEHKIDGIILPVSSMSDELIQVLISNHFPFVIMGEPDQEEQEVFWVDMDNEQGGSFAVDHLVQQGYRCPILFVENKKTVFEKKRIAGFKKGLLENGITWREQRVVECGTDATTIAETVEKILKSSEKVDSVICTNNIVAHYVLRELRNHQLNVPDDIGVVTFDNYPLAEYMEPPLTVVDVDTYKLGEAAAIALFEEIKQVTKKEENISIPTQIIARESTKKGRGM
jgi:DNA-binding LacI/PurR family transcriptional regulator